MNDNEFVHDVLSDECVLYGSIRNFRLTSKINEVEAVVDILGLENEPDRNLRIWQKETLNKVLNNRVILHTPRGHKSWFWLNQMLRSIEINNSYYMIDTPSKDIDINHVINWNQSIINDVCEYIRERSSIVHLDSIPVRCFYEDIDDIMFPLNYAKRKNHVDYLNDVKVERTITICGHTYPVGDLVDMWFDGKLPLMGNNEIKPYENKNMSTDWLKSHNKRKHKRR